MDYKDTLNLPRTDFPMRARLPDREPRQVEEWDENRIHERMLEARSDAPVFLLHDGPPYANGRIHIGHALNKILKDIVLKHRHLSGWQTPYRPGWDCHGLPIELEVEKKLGRKARAELDVVEVRKLCRQYAERFVGLQAEEFRRLGIFADWDNPYLTTDFSYEASEAREFAALVETGAVYRGRKPVHWCASCSTALAEAEVDYADHRSTSVYVVFELDDLEGTPLQDFAGQRLGLVIWTTTPWTLPANLAVALHPAYDYALVEAGDGRKLIVAAGLIDQLKERLGLGGTLVTFKGADLEGRRARHPWLDRDSLVVTGLHVTLEAGSGCVHTAPGHGEDDYAVGLRYGLEAYAPVDHYGRFTDEVAEFAGRRVFDSDPDIVALLESKGALLACQEITHSYPHCWRCRKPIIFRATDQWFVSMDKGGLRSKALSEIGRTRWIPAWGQERIHGMIENRPDWCISRQRVWGVPVVALRCVACAEVFTTPELARHAAGLFAEQGSDVWFSAPEVSQLLPPQTACPACDQHEFERETDILDVWFDSGVSFAAVIEADHGTEAVADLYLEGSDQHRGWFHSALLVSTATRRRAPYKAVLTHGFVLDGSGHKMSKSKGNVISPQDIMKRYGADILRLWVAAEDYRDDVRISDEIMERLADSYRRIRNTARNALGNLCDFDPTSHTVLPAEMEELDRWALLRLNDLVARCRQAYENYEFNVVYHALNNFCSVDMSSLYFDIVKDRLYCSARQSRERRSAQTAMYQIVSGLAGIIAPILPFTAEEIWQQIGGRGDSIFFSDFPEVVEAWQNPELERRWQRLLEIRAEVTRALETERQAGSIGHSLDARVRLCATAGDMEVLGTLGPEALAAIYIVSQVELEAGDSPTPTVEVLAALGAKCGRCWNYSESVGSHSDHPEVCDRCHAVVAAFSE
ncbi:MAG: isoleucine--tRNA ligase [Deltaproteobacteria bacterium]